MSIKDRLKLNKELTKELSNELGIEEDKIPIIVDKLIEHPKFQKELTGRILEQPWFYDRLTNQLAKDHKVRDSVVNAMSRFFGRRSLLEAGAAGLGALIGASALAGARTIITDVPTTKLPAGDFYFPEAMPYSTIVFINGSKVIAQDWRGKVITQGVAGVDDADVIQSAIDSIPSGLGLDLSQTGGKVLISAGTYKINKTILLRKTKAFLEGIGRSVLQASGADPIIDFGGESSDIRIDYSGLRSLILDGAGSSATLVNWQYSNRCYIEKCVLQNTTGHGLHITEVFAGSCVYDVGISYCGSIDKGTYPLRIDGDVHLSNHITFFNCGFGQPKNTAIYIPNGCNLLTFERIWVEGDPIDAHAIDINYGERVNLKDVVVVNTAAQGYHGIRIYGGRDNVLNRCVVLNAPGRGFNTYSERTRLVNCHAELCGENGFVIHGQRNIMHGCSAVNNAQNIWAVGISCNDLKNSVIRDCIAIDTQDSPTQRYGLSIDQYCDTLKVIGSIFDGNVLGAVANSGTNITFRDNDGYPTENHDTATFSGDGVAKVFNVASHGLAENPTDRTKILAWATTQSPDADAAAPVSAYPADLDGDGKYEGLKIVFASAPAAGTNNVVVDWYAMLV